MRFNYEKLPNMDSNSSSLTNHYMSTKLKKLSCYRKLILSLEKSSVICSIPKSNANGFNFFFFFFLEESSLYWTRTRWCILLTLAGRWIAISSRPTWSTSKHQDSQGCTETVSIQQKWTESHCDMSCPITCCVPQTGTELSAILLLQPSKCWEYKPHLP